MRNYTLVVDKKDTAESVINSITDDLCINPVSDPFCFSCIAKQHEEDDNKVVIKFNILEGTQEKSNPYTINKIIHKLYMKYDTTKKVNYVMPNLETYLDVFRPNLQSMVNKAYKNYSNLIPNKDDLMSTLMFTVTKLHNKGYYLHNNLIYRAFINELNMEIRHTKYENVVSIEENVNCDDENIHLGDLLVDEEETNNAYAQYHYTEEEYWEDVFNMIKEDMLKHMSQLSFDRILMQLKTKTVDHETSLVLKKYRDKYNPDYQPRPNAHRDNKPKAPKLKGGKANGTN